MEKPIELYLISGFLGAGKTTLLQSLVGQFPAGRLGVLVNEFGSFGVDGSLVQGEAIHLVELNNGSIFCACLKEGFVRALMDFAALPIQTLLIEISGMGDPSPMATLLEGLKHYLPRPYQLRGNLCVVDATGFCDAVEVLATVHNQVAVADLILVNKTDLVSLPELQAVHRAIRAINPDVPCINTRYARLPEGFLGQLASRGAAGEGSNTPASRPGSYLLTAAGHWSQNQLMAFCNDIGPLCYRLKGFARGEEGWWRVDGVGAATQIHPADPPDELPGSDAALILIAAPGQALEAKAEAAWLRHCGGAAAVEQM